MKTWAVANQKGGVGKTTTAISLGGLCAARGEATLLIDLDPHGSMTSYFGMDPGCVEQGTYNLFQAEHLDRQTVLDLVQPTQEQNLFFLPAATALATLERQSKAQDGMGLVITTALRAVEDRFAQVYLDCPPMLGVLMVNALAACQQLIIPVQTEFLALKGLERMMQTLKMIEAARQIRVPFTVLPTMFDRRTRASVDSLATLHDRFSNGLWDGLIPIDTRFREASRMGRPLGHLWPSSRGAQGYREFLEDVNPLPQAQHTAVGS